MLGVSYAAVGQVLGHRHAAGEQELRADAPVAEIGEGDDHLAADAQELLQHEARIVGRLQRLAQDDEVEGVVRVGRKIVVGVALDDRQAARDGFVDVLLRQLDAAPVRLLLGFQPLQQRAVLAADVEHAHAASRSRR